MLQYFFICAIIPHSNSEIYPWGLLSLIKHLEGSHSGLVHRAKFLAGRIRKNTVRSNRTPSAKKLVADFRRLFFLGKILPLF